MMRYNFYLNINLDMYFVDTVQYSNVLDMDQISLKNYSRIINRATLPTCVQLILRDCAKDQNKVHFVTPQVVPHVRNVLVHFKYLI